MKELCTPADMHMQHLSAEFLYALVAKQVLSDI